MRSATLSPTRTTISAGLVMGVLALALVLSPVLSMGFGAAPVPPGDVVKVFLAHFPGANGGVDGILDAIVWQNRLPRVLTGVGVGAILGVSGVVLQAIVRNPLAEPYVLGVSSGASTGAAVAIILVGVTSSVGVAGFAFVGAAIATLIVLGGGARSAYSLILAGLAVGFVFGSITNLVIFSADSAETARSVMFWSLGSLTRSTWPQVWGVLGIAVALTVAFWWTGPLLDALAGGDQTAMAVGLNPGRVRLVLTLVVSAAVAFAVATAGGIGFVGLMVPHLVRFGVGHAHRLLVVGTSMAAAIFLVWADALARTVFSPAEVPIGVITGLMGAPFLLVLARRRA